MGDRAAISFCIGERQDGHWRFPSECSVYLYSHWGGEHFVNLAKAFLEEVHHRYVVSGSTTPLDRGEPSAVIVEFLKKHADMVDRIRDSTTKYGGLDAGAWELNIGTGEARRVDD